MLLYLTYNDQPSGVYWSQVTDVVDHLNTLGSEEVRLVALVSVRDLRNTRRRIKAHSPKAWVLPMVPQMKRWRMNTVFLASVCRLLKPSGIIARGPFATWMALRMRDRKLTRKVCYDGRGAYAAEWEEYRIIDDDSLIAQFRPLEKEAVNASDLRIAVSHALLEHWRERYGYTAENHVVIPCTLGNGLGPEVTDDRTTRRRELGFAPDDVVLVYAGSTAGWQSFGLLETLLSGIMDRQPEVKVLFLSKADANNQLLADRYPGRVQVKWLDPADVQRTLQACDHGILVREDTITNHVASPTKFAEYLSAGLPVIISDGLGDFSALVREERLGQVVTSGQLPVVTPASAEDRQRLRAFAKERFSKGAFAKEYTTLLRQLSA